MELAILGPQVSPIEPAFENYYPQNYDRLEGGEFVGLEPLGDLDIKIDRTFEAFARARRAELTGDGTHVPPGAGANHHANCAKNSSAPDDPDGQTQCFDVSFLSTARTTGVE